MSLALGAISKLWGGPKDQTPPSDARTDSSNIHHLRSCCHEGAQEYARKDEEDTVIDFNAPIHWWMVSTLFPSIAGTFGPMASKLRSFLG